MEREVIWLELRIHVYDNLDQLIHCAKVIVNSSASFGNVDSKLGLGWLFSNTMCHKHIYSCRLESKPSLEILEFKILFTAKIKAYKKTNLALPHHPRHTHVLYRGGSHRQPRDHSHKRTPALLIPVCWRWRRCRNGVFRCWRSRAACEEGPSCGRRLEPVRGGFWGALGAAAFRQRAGRGCGVEPGGLV
ncbi:hypothetical protein P175DRAFT_0346663 [Aspergillus ochraceoroseus IBT 24754]|uniref:Uncharacterized protein n=1 Tax=Aspergillus ochraceoroseus IBT 24754 TaxID=1392256 RepID=A0A2T5LP46_9EURO|nr:uncharacterized protein P175DRAFT_0346663 [Aspergillus ochraceoroseus IBT 24754]PTU18053.1 hypothetical protein P175DRAFT_0346663 [Aspergillus ochraceoroseus IBT 24754]